VGLIGDLAMIAPKRSAEGPHPPMATAPPRRFIDLPGALFLEGNDGGHSIKTREYAVTMAGFPRVRVRHHKDGVTIYLDAK
jgi:hypothetical protein